MSDSPAGSTLAPENAGPQPGARLRSLGAAAGYALATSTVAYVTLHAESTMGAWMLALLIVAMTVHGASSASLRILHSVAALPALFLTVLLIVASPPWSDFAPTTRLTIAALLAILVALGIGRSLGMSVSGIGLGYGRIRPDSASRQRSLLWLSGAWIATLIASLAFQLIAVVAAFAARAVQTRLHGTDALTGLLSLDLAGLALVLVVAALAEELLFRGALQSAAVRAWRAPTGVLFAAAAYGAVFLVVLPLDEAAFMSGLGLAFGAVARLTGSIWGLVVGTALAYVWVLASPTACADTGALATVTCWMDGLWNLIVSGRIL